MLKINGKLVPSAIVTVCTYNILLWNGASIRNGSKLNDLIGFRKKNNKRVEQTSHKMCDLVWNKARFARAENASSSTK